MRGGCGGENQKQRQSVRERGKISPGNEKKVKGESAGNITGGQKHTTLNRDKIYIYLQANFLDFSLYLLFILGVGLIVILNHDFKMLQNFHSFTGRVKY